jgi:hypothetical protein
MLIGDGIFVKAICQGVEQGDYVYRSGDLLYGKGDPQPQIRIDEQSLVFTLAYATEKGIWPRSAPEPAQILAGRESAETNGGSATDGRNADGDGKVTPLDRSPPPESEPELKAEGVLREALTHLWEQARGKRIDALAQLSLRLFEPGDGFRLMGAVNAVNGATKVVRLHGGYETNDRGTLQFEFAGPINDALPIKDFLDPQFRAAKDRDFDLAFDLDFADGLSLGGDAPEKLTERLARYSSGAAYVSATARTQH